MKTIYIQIITVLIFSTNSVLSQTDSPIGKWILTEHLVQDSFDNKNGYWVDKNVYNNEFEAYLIFEPNGELYYQNGDCVKVGKWKLKRKGKKLKMKFGFMSGEVHHYRNTINFEAPFYSSDYFEQLYTTTRDSLVGGKSKFIRVFGEEPKIEKSLFVGKWKTVKFKERKKEILIHDPYIFELTSSNKAIYENTKGEWKVNGKKLTIDYRENKNEYYSSSVSTKKIIKINDKEMVYLEKRNKNNRIVYLEKIM